MNSTRTTLSSPTDLRTALNSSPNSALRENREPALTIATSLLEQAGLSVRATVELPPRDPNLLPVCQQLHPDGRHPLDQEFPSGLHSHQCQAIAASLNGQNVRLATSTASGKSLPFMSVRADELLRDPRSRVLVLYPAKALIQDQSAKWAGILRPLGLKAGFIDGSVAVSERNDIRQRHRVVLMTPHVAHEQNHLVQSHDRRAEDGRMSPTRVFRQKQPD
jgi:DEAD/DEAH box helicase domain-containing protein